MIVTVTANPSVDRTIEVAELAPGAVIRALSNRVDAGGKGVNVARALARHGHKATAVVACGGAEGAQLMALLDGSGLDVQPVPIRGAVRSNITVVDAAGITTKLNEPGPTLSPAELEALAAGTIDAAARADWVVLSGSLPPGAPAGWYADIRRRLIPAGCRVAVDTSGPALAAAVDAAPDLIKPNRHELAEITGRPITTPADAAAAAGGLVARGVGAVLVSLGSAGALLAEPRGCWFARAPEVPARSSVGAGDAALAGFLASGASGPDSLIEAVAWGSAAVSLPGSRMPAPQDISRTGIPLSEPNDSPLPEES